jgi:hypothetical protein
LVTDTVAQTATKFNAETHIKLFKETFGNLKIDDINDFLIAQTADSTAMNPKIARDMGINHVACRNHCLNLGCKDMENNCKELKSISEKTQEIHHRKIKGSNKLSAVLENTQAAARLMDTGASMGKLKLLAATRWNSLEGLLQSHKKASESIREVVEKHPERDLGDDTISFNFLRKINRHLKYLTALKSASCNMQKHLATLKYCQFQCDTITKCAHEGKDECGHDFEFCK